jgi:hypothetical protein
VLNGRVWFCRGKQPEDPGIGLDIDSAAALTVAHIAIENFDVGVRIRGLTSVSLRDIYYEADLNPNPFPDGFWMDLRPAKGSIVRMENSVVNVKRSLILGGSFEDAVTSSTGSASSTTCRRATASTWWAGSCRPD